MANIVVFGHDDVAGRAVALEKRALLIEACQFTSKQDPGVGTIWIMPDVLSFDARRIEDFHPDAKVEYLDPAAQAAAVPARNTASLTAAKGPGGRWFVKRGSEIVTGPFETEADARAAIARETGEKVGLGTDSGDQLSDEQLRAIIEQATGEKVHHKTGREKLVARYNELNAKAARQEETASNGLTRREIEADLEGEGVEFDPRDSVEDLAALRDMAREARGA